MAHGYLENFNLLKGEELLAVCGLFTDKVEGGAGPEFFLDLTRLPEPEKAITELRELLVPSLGEHLWASLATSRFVARAATLAQCAGQVRGTGGVVLVPAGAEAAFLAPLPLHYLWPLAPRLRERLGLLGLKTIGQVAKLPTEELQRFFGPEGYRVAQLSRGRDGSRVQGVPPAYLEYRSPWGEEADRGRLTAWCVAAAGYLARGEGRRAAWGRRLELTLFPEAGPPLVAAREFNRPELTAIDLGIALQRLLPTVLPERLSTVAARLGPLVPLAAGQLSLLSAARPARERGGLLEVLARLEKRYPGRVHFGSRQPPSRREQVLAFFDPLRRGPGVERPQEGHCHAAG